ncbi:MAG: ABC transporter ATP-binding protein [Brevefilum sp.]|nr:ABC transporter ATP-binding protein [Brevefilum sp.]
MINAPVILTEGLTRHFDDIIAVDDLNLEIYPGEVLGFLGHNGAGKTTTVRLLNGVLTPTSGKAQVLGLDPSTDGAELRRRTGVLTETPSVDERLTGYENLAIFAALFNIPPAAVESRVAEVLEIFQLTDRAGDRVSEYSKGMKQKLALARAIIHQPELLFLDEPTSGLDPVITRQVHTLIRELSRDGNHTVFLCTHNLAEAQRLCDRVAVLENGRMVALGSPAELARDLWKGMRLEVETTTEAIPAAIKALTAIPDTREVVQEQGHPVISLSLNLRDQVPGVVSCLVAAGVPIFRLTPKEPTLEDIYFALHENHKEMPA